MHVALIQEEGHLTMTEMAEFYSRNSLLGKIDRIVAKKTELKVKDMFKPFGAQSDRGLNKGMRILVDGAPGVGKTTLGRKISKDWAEEKILKGYDLVMLLELRKQQFAKATSLKHIFPHSYDEKLQQQVVDHVGRSKGSKILIIFDGFDELTDPSENLLLFTLLKQEVLPNCTIMVTSRQYASNRVHQLQCIDRHFEVLGFTEEEIQNCIRAGVADESKATALIEHLSQRQDISCLCYIPLVCSMVIYVYMEMNYTLPSTSTELFHQLVLIAAKRQAKRRYDRPVLTADDLKTLPQPTYNELDILCEMAFKNLEDDKAIFYSEDLESLPYGCRDIESHTLGLVTAVKSYPIFDEQLNYQFLHLTIQEFLSAKWIVDHWPPSKQGAYFKEKQQDDRFRLVLVFLAGLSGLKSKDFHDVFANMVDFTNKTDFRYLAPSVQLESSSHEKRNENNYHIETQKFLLLLLFLHEAKNETLCATLATAVSHQIIDLRNARFTLFHCRALGYFLSRSYCNWKALHLPVHGLNDRSIQLFHDSFSGTAASSVIEMTVGQISHHVPVSANDITQQGARLLCSIPLLRQCESITFMYKHLAAEGPDALSNFLSLQSTKTLCISRKFNQNTPLQIPLDIENHLQSNRTLQILHLYACGIDCAMSEMLAKAIRENATLKELSLRTNQIRGAGATALFESLEVNNSLRSLDLTCNPELTKMSLVTTAPVINPALEALEQMLTVNKLLQMLNLDDCGLSGTAVESVARGLTYNKGLETLSISVYFDLKSGLVRGTPLMVGILAATNVFKSLQVNQCLKKLLLTFRFDLDVQCTEALSHSIEEMFTVNKSLQVLELHLMLGEHGIISYTCLSCFEQFLASGLKQNSSIKELSFTGQFFVPNACQMLFDSLKHHPSLVKLSIDMAYDSDSVKALANMLSSNSTLEYLNLCSFLLLLRKTFAPKVFKGVEIPEGMKTDRGDPDVQSQDVMQLLHEAYPRLPETIKKVRDELPEADQGKLSPEPLVPTTAFWSFSVLSLNQDREFPPVDPRTAVPASACIQIFKSLEYNCTLKKIHLPVETFSNFHTFFELFLDIVGNNPTLSSVTLHSNDQVPSIEWLEVFTKRSVTVRPQMKRFGRGTVEMNFVKCGFKFRRNYTELFSQPAT